jgi:hypothetical protein
VSYTPNPLDPSRPVLSDDAGQLTEELRALKQHNVNEAATVQTHTERLAELGNAANRDIFVSTAVPNPSLGEDGDLWIQHDA